MTRSTSGHYSRTAAQSPAGGHHTLAETESAVSERLANLELDMGSMAAVQNVYRAANAFRNHLERTVLAPHELTWTGWVVLWVVWIWGDIETRHAATEAGISKGTLTGVVGTLEGRGFLTRRTHPDDARRVLLALTAKGKRLMSQVFPEFNREEARLMSALSTDEVATLTQGLRKAVASLDD
jgi:DNA-binding MarR family transcriptional regulator